MRLTNFTDFALRLLMYAAAHDDRLITIEETSEVYGISRAHLMKITNALTKAGFLKAVRGRSGGLMLAEPPRKIRRVRPDRQCERFVDPDHPFFRRRRAVRLPIHVRCEN